MVMEKSTYLSLEPWPGNMAKKLPLQSQTGTGI